MPSYTICTRTGVLRPNGMLVVPVPSEVLCEPGRTDGDWAGRPARRMQVARAQRTMARS
jgi:hypothetical protein